jgi:hypothetical protein
MLRAAILGLCLVLAGCGRPLTDSETAYLSALTGDRIDLAAMRLVDGNPAGAISYTIPVRPRLTCQERLWPPLQEARRVRVSPGASVLFNTVMLRRDLYRDDFLAGFPERIDLYQAMLLAHEAVHVWQWQARARTGYHPLRALNEHAVRDDPYLFDPDTGRRRFLEYGYEQQGAIVEEFVCCAILDPEAPRTARLRALISQDLPVAGLEAMLGNPDIVVPWSGAQVRGICRA